MNKDQGTCFNPSQPPTQPKMILDFPFEFQGGVGGGLGLKVDFE